MENLHINHNFFDLSYEEFQDLVEKAQIKKIHAFNFFTNVYKQRVQSATNQNYPEIFEQFIKKFKFELPQIINIQKSIDDKTVKFLSKLSDNTTVETVLVPFHKKYTICISSQVGCAMKCSFCFTGTQGLKRNLSVNEIIGQYLLAHDYIKENFKNKDAAPNIVFMGQGEPLHNFDNVKKAISIFLSPAGFNLGPRQITLSTSGFIPGLLRFHELWNINLAISFHSPFNEERSQLIPINNSYPIEDLLKVLKDIPRLKRQYINIEYLIIKDLNHSSLHAQRIFELFKDIPIIINLIPFNEFPGASFKRPTEQAVESFKKMLKDYHFPVLTRTTKGDDILAACGQLNTKE